MKIALIGYGNMAEALGSRSPIWACPPAPRHAPLRSDSIYSRQSEEPKTGCQREPTAPLALSSSERRDPAHFARLRPLRRPSRPKQHRDFHQTERRLTSHRSGDIAQARKKGGLKFLYIQKSRSCNGLLVAPWLTTERGLIEQQTAHV